MFTSTAKAPPWGNTMPGWGEEKSHSEPVSLTLAIRCQGNSSFQGWHPSQSLPVLGSRGQQRGPGPTVFGTLGQLYWDWLLQGTKNFICVDKTQRLNGCTHGYSCPFPHAAVCAVSGSVQRLGPSARSPQQRPRQPWRQGRGAGGCCPLAARPPLHLPPGHGAKWPMAKGRGALGGDTQTPQPSS